MRGEPLEKIKQVREGPQHLRRLIQTLFTRAKNHKRGLCMTRSLLLAEKLMQHDICVSDCSLQNLPRKHPRDRFKGKRLCPTPHSSGENRNVPFHRLQQEKADGLLNHLPVLLTECQLGATKAGWSQSTLAPNASRGPAAAAGPRSAAEASGTAPTSQQSPPAAQELIPTVSQTAVQKVGTCTGKSVPGGHARQGVYHRAALTAKQAAGVCKGERASATELDFGRQQFTS
ncbi:hypothetical protein Anapl_03951 [Anas platyrhynchos]|uniref:Uncharacterized protein n=1 Tax=Anas platyrhynchos TaxID=8839 RepID=R0M4B5_ANAPL|nr:hypothetical protein Anapl_03951 [Anas platyrhynchos]